jgi:alpha-L-fucosidase 2
MAGVHSTEKQMKDLCQFHFVLTLLTILPCWDAVAHDTSKTADSDRELVLWNTKPATRWLEAMPLGNGRLGAMVFGGVADEQLVLNDDTLYADEPGDLDLPLDITKDFALVTNLIQTGQYAEADAYVTKHWTGRAVPCYEPLGNLRFHFEGSGDVSNYLRELDLKEAVAKVSYSQNGVGFEREVFVSHPDDAMIIRLRADKPGALSFGLTLDSPHPTAKLSAAQNEVVMTGQLPGFALRRTLDYVEQHSEQWKYPEAWNQDGSRKPFAKEILYGDDVGNRGMRFEARVRVLQCDGKATLSQGGLQIEKAQEVVLALAAASSFNGFDKSPSRQGVEPSARTAPVLARIAHTSYQKLRAAHVADYQRLFNRVSFHLADQGGGGRSSTNEASDDSSKTDWSLPALTLQFGRYLLIASSRPGSQPANLQGIWNVDRIPPWASAYTENINLQMNYWGAETANLSECHEPLFQLLRETAVTGGRVAKEMYHRPGWVLHHNTSIWRDAQPVDWFGYISVWPMGGGWLCQHLWEHYQFTQDRAFLRDTAYPLMKGAAEFYDRWLVEDGHQHLLTPVSCSPENMFGYTDKSGRKREGGFAMGSTLDMAIIRELFRNTLEAGTLLNTDQAWRQHLAARMQKLLPYQIGSRGQLLEYYKEFDPVPPRHNTSPFYPLYPSDQITPRGTPELAAAEKKLLEERAKTGGGWPAAWLSCCWARLGEAETAYNYVSHLISRDHHHFFSSGGSGSVFQIDQYLGSMAAMAEMLLQSHGGEIELLPALPKAWPSGTVTGLRARGGFEVDIRWQDGKLSAAAIKSVTGTDCKVRYGEKTIILKLKRGQTKHLDTKGWTS